MKRNHLPVWVVHLLFFAAFALYEVSMTYLLGYSPPLLSFLPFYLLALIFFYFNAHIAMSLWYGKNRWVVPFLLLVEIGLHFICTNTLRTAVIAFITGENIHHVKISQIELVQNLYRSIYILGLSITYWLWLHTSKQAKALSDAQITKLELENAYLRAQANPHLLFNVFNMLQSDIKKSAPEASETLMLLSEIMQYAYLPTGADGKTQLDEEIAQVKRYLLLQGKRFPLMKVELLEDISCNTDDLRIPPLTLLTPVENLFKYGNIVTPVEPPTIRITCRGNTIHLNTRNEISSNSVFKSKYSTGLSNLRAILVNYYPDRFILKQYTVNGIFELELEIVL